jgi:hypothetical protein
MAGTGRRQSRVKTNDSGFTDVYDKASCRVTGIK